MFEMTHDTERPISIPFKDKSLDGILHIPKMAIGTVIFVHGSGSSRFSARNQFVAATLQQEKFATLLFDLLTPDEDAIDEQTRQYRFDIELLAERLITVTEWLRQNLQLKQLPIGYFGASTGGGAALLAASRQDQSINAIVSRGGRPDLAGDAALKAVTSPTLLIVGGDDPEVIELNQQALHHLQCEKKLEIVPGATHLFEEPGKLEAVSTLANAWFKTYLC